MLINLDEFNFLLKPLLILHENKSREGKGTALTQHQANIYCRGLSSPECLFLKTIIENTQALQLKKLALNVSLCCTLTCHIWSNKRTPLFSHDPTAKIIEVKLMNVICRLSLYQQTLQMCQRDVFMAERGGRDRGSMGRPELRQGTR